MGVDRQDYIVYGWKLPYYMRDSQENAINLHSDKYRPYVEGSRESDGYVLLRDAYDTQYLVFGKTIASGGYQNEGWNFVHLDLQKLDPDAVKAKYRELFGTEGECAEPYLFIFTHWC